MSTNIETIPYEEALLTLIERGTGDEKLEPVIESFKNLVRERDMLWENLLKSYEVASRGGQ